MANTWNLPSEFASLDEIPIDFDRAASSQCVRERHFQRVWSKMLDKTGENGSNAAAASS
jgi:hypothetical protein